jgi:AcrR family transcriptional regulator
MPRLSRKEKQAHTRTCLMNSAAKVFADRGLQQASIDDVAEEAGFTKGAFYANFKNKEELFLAMLDERFAEKIEQLEQVMAEDTTDSEKALRAGDDFTQKLLADPEWHRLFFEFSAYALRNPDFRDELITRYRWLQDRIATALSEDSKLELVAPIPYSQIAMMTCAMANGIALEKLLEGDNVPDESFGTMLMIFFRGLKAIEEEAEAASASPSESAPAPLGAPPR